EVSLYQRLGKRPAIEAVIGELIANVGADERINFRFATADLGALKVKLADQICEASGGPCKYSGRAMAAAHAGMGISGPEFDALVEDLIRALDKLGVGEREKAELLGALGGLKPQIVEGP